MIKTVLLLVTIILLLLYSIQMIKYGKFVDKLQINLKITNESMVSVQSHFLRTSHGLISTIVGLLRTAILMYAASFSTSKMNSASLRIFSILSMYGGIAFPPTPIL